MEENPAYHEDLAQDAPRLASVPQQRPQGLPEGYFDAFAERLMARIDAEGDLPTTLADLPRLTPSVPEGYFEQFQGRLLNRIAAEDEAAEAELLARVPKALPAVSEGYFAQLQDRVLDRIADQENADILARLPKEQPAVPAGYFDGLTARVMARVQADAPAQAPAGGKLVRTGWWKQTRVWAAAAVLVLAATTAFLVLRGDTPMATDTLAAEQAASAELKVQLASLEDDAVINALKQSQVSDEELFAVMGADATQDLEMGEAVEDDAAADYLDEADVDDLDLEDLNLDQMDLSDINL
jgi:hypothetical protein